MPAHFQRAICPILKDPWGRPWIDRSHPVRLTEASFAFCWHIRQRPISIFSETSPHCSQATYRPVRPEVILTPISRSNTLWQGRHTIITFEGSYVPPRQPGTFRCLVRFSRSWQRSHSPIGPLVMESVYFKKGDRATKAVAARCKRYRRGCATPEWLYDKASRNWR